MLYYLKVSYIQNYIKAFFTSCFKYALDKYLQ